MSQSSSPTSAIAGGSTSSQRNATGVVVLCPGQGAQAIGMGRAWSDHSPSARATLEEADAILRQEAGASAARDFADHPLSTICFHGPPATLNRTDISQPAIYTCSVASWRGLLEMHGEVPIVATAGLSLGEYTALHLAGVFDFATGLRLVALRGRLMQEAAETSHGSMVALIGADERQAREVCAKATAAEDTTDGPVLVCANYNAPGQIVLSGSIKACTRAVEIASELGLRATPLTVAGAFHSPLMQPAADRLGEALAEVEFTSPSLPVYANVTAEPHPPGTPNLELLKQRLIEQIVSPVKWAQTCANLASSEACGTDRPYHELAPGSVLRGLMRRIDRKIEVTTHDQPSD